MINNDLYGKYASLLPSKFNGGYLVIALYKKIKNLEFEKYFTQKEINKILADIRVWPNLEFILPWNNIKDNLFHHFLLCHPNEPWKY